MTTILVKDALRASVEAASAENRRCCIPQGTADLCEYYPEGEYRKHEPGAGDFRRTSGL